MVPVARLYRQDDSFTGWVAHEIVASRFEACKESPHYLSIAPNHALGLFDRFFGPFRKAFAELRSALLKDGAAPAVAYDQLRSRSDEATRRS